MSKRKMSDLEKIIKTREILMSQWNVNNAFVILWAYGDGSNKEDNRTKGTQNNISFTNTEKSQIDAIAKILGLEDRIYQYQPKNPKWNLTHSITWADQILSDYLHKMGLRLKKTDVGARLPLDFPNHLIDVGAYAFWIANGGLKRDKIRPSVYFYSSHEFLIDFQIELEKHVNFPSGIGNLRKQAETSEGKVELWILEYNGKNCYRILSAMFKRTANICWSVKRDKTIRLVSNYTNIFLYRRNKIKQPQLPSKLKNTVALYDALDLMNPRTRQRYIRYCGENIEEVRKRAEANWHLGKEK